MSKMKNKNALNSADIHCSIEGTIDQNGEQTNNDYISSMISDLPDNNWREIWDDAFNQ